MKNSTILAFFGCWIAPSLVFMILTQSFNSIVLFVSLSVCLLHMVFLAIPVYFYLESRKKLNMTSIFLSGALIGSIPFVLFSLFVNSSYGPGASYVVFDEGIKRELLRNGELTRDGWISLSFQAGEMALLGLISGFVFWIIWRAGIKKMFMDQ